MTEPTFNDGRPSAIPYLTTGAIVGGALGHCGVRIHEARIPERNANAAAQNMYLRSMSESLQAESAAKFQDAASKNISMTAMREHERAHFARVGAIEADLSRTLVPEATRLSRHMRVGIPAAAAALGALYGMASYGG